ncbi:hypothetical protein EV128_110155 [Rhizobium azibense]|nr:hypothetical protein EV128_110155 [Rhizobium azibense]
MSTEFGAKPMRLEPQPLHSPAPFHGSGAHVASHCPPALLGTNRAKSLVWFDHLGAVVVDDVQRGHRLVDLLVRPRVSSAGRSQVGEGLLPVACRRAP